jgi:predicted nucleotidyltransferase
VGVEEHRPVTATSALADEVAALVHELLGDELIGAYLHGSAVLGGLRPHSDVDVLAVTRRRTTDDERRAIVVRLLDISGRRARRGPARSVELTVVVQDDVRPWRPAPVMDLQYGDWLRDEYERGVIAPAGPNADLAVVVTMTLRGDRPLLGPPPAAVLDPVPEEDLIRSVVAGVPGLLDELESDTRNVILTLARIWTTVATGEIRTKDGAADWVLARLPAVHRPVLVHARAVYLGEDEDRWTELAAGVRPHAEHVVAEIERALAHR